MRLGFVRDRSRFSEAIGSPALGDASADRAGGVLLARFDQLDNVRIPRSGWTAPRPGRASTGSSSAADTSYNKVSASALGARSFGEWTLHGGFEASGPFGGTRLPFFDLNWLGGYFAALGPPDETSSTGSTPVWCASGPATASRSCRASSGAASSSARPSEAGNVWFRTEDIKPSNLIWGGSLYGAADTILGPHLPRLGDRGAGEQHVLPVARAADLGRVRPV
ncbi:MAG: hypothetical protein MZW92_29900 [Comamonadaceae bacterium]|nr:hypothetical protein [Comamonadaceae bacterium]